MFDPANLFLFIYLVSLFQRNTFKIDIMKHLSNRCPAKYQVLSHSPLLRFNPPTCPAPGVANLPYPSGCMLLRDHSTAP